MEILIDFLQQTVPGPLPGSPLGGRHAPAMHQPWSTFTQLTLGSSQYFMRRLQNTDFHRVVIFL